LKIKKYTNSYDEIDKDIEVKKNFQFFCKIFQKTGFKNKENLWTQIQDFDWLRSDKSPNFAIIE